MLCNSRKNSSSSPKAGYQKLSSNSFAAAEDRVSRTHVRDNEQHVSHARTGSSPASMAGKSSNVSSLFLVGISTYKINLFSGRPMSNTLPKNSGRNVSPDKNDNKPLTEIQKVNYANTGEEVFYF